VKKSYEYLFQPLKLAGVEIKNRIAMAPMATPLVTREGGFTKRAADYYIERAKGGTGLIITSLIKVEREIEDLAVPDLACVTYNPNHFISSTKEMTERIQAYGAKIFLQSTAGIGRNKLPAPHLHTPVSPSPVPNFWDPNIICRELTTGEVETLIKKFGEAAEIAVMAGFDGIEVHAVHEGYLMDQFTMALFNRRTDKYGGDLRQRLTLPIEVLQEIKKKAGPDFPVLLRFSVKSYIKSLGVGGLPGEEFEELGRDVGEALEAAKILAEAGYDGFDCDAGSYDAWYWAHPPNYQDHGCYLPLAEKVKKAVSVPIIVAGRMDVPDLAEEALASGKIDMVSLGRQLLADPYWPKKVRAGRIDKIRPCLGCHDGCLGRNIRNAPLSCAVNPACGREEEYSLRTAPAARQVMIAGGGVAGMEAARVAASRGHQVTIFEKGRELGGHVIEAAVPDFKKEHVRLLNWYKNELEELKVRIVLNTAVSDKLIAREKPEIVIVATGSRPVSLELPGIHQDKVILASDLLTGKRPSGNSIAIIGGGLIGCEVALWLAKQEKKVTIVEALDDIMTAGQPVPLPNRMMLVSLLQFHKVKVLTRTRPSELTSDGIVVATGSGQKETLPVDTVVVSVGLRPDRELYDSLAGRVEEIYLIGDAREAVNIMQAIWDAYEIALCL
jgi:2-enoate reductase